MERRSPAAHASARGREHDERALPGLLPASHRNRAGYHGAHVNFAREGISFILISALVAVGAFGLAVSRRSWPLWLAAFLLTFFALWVAYFFRDPERTGERGERIVIAPADGKVIQIADVDEPAFMHGRATRVSIFMNVFNVHVNR